MMDRPIITILSGEDLSQIAAYRSYTSLRWENKSAGAGEFEIHLPGFADIPCGSVVHLCCDVREPYGTVIYVRHEIAETVVIGKMLSGLFSWRFPVKDGAALTYSASDGAARLVCEAAVYGCLSDENYFFGKAVKTAYQAESKAVQYPGSLAESCLEAMSCIANDAKKTFSVTLDGGAVSVWAGDYKSCAVTLGSGLGGLKNPTLTRSVDNSRNLLAYSQKDGDGYIYKTYPALDAPSGAARRVAYLGKFDDTPGAQIRIKRNYFKETNSFEAEIMPSLRPLIFAGGSVKIEVLQWGLSDSFNITSLTDIWEDGYSCRVTFGDASPTAYEKIIQRI